MINEAIEILSCRRDLSAAQMSAVMEEIMTGKADTPAITSFLTALSNKGETPDELTAAVSVMRKYVTKISVSGRVVLDTCGTGGDAKGTFNISTAVAFVAAGCGITVAKHGNRSVSSSSGSADVLEALGININMPVQNIERCLKDIGIAFLFAQNLHPAMKYAMSARKFIGKRTMFNLLGPLTNPAGATHQLVGVYSKNWVRITANVLRNLRTIHALVIHGSDGLDEITTTGTTFVAEARKGEFKTYEINHGDFGITKAELSDLRGASAADNAEIIRGVLGGKPGPYRDIIILNAAAAIYAADKTSSIKEGIALAEESIDSKMALKKLELLREYSQR